MTRRKLVQMAGVALFLSGSVGATAFAKNHESVSCGPLVERGYPATSSGSPGEYGQLCRPGRRFEEMLKTLGITAAQNTEMRAPHVRFRDRARTICMNLMTAKDEKHAMLLSGKIDRHTLGELRDQTSPFLATSVGRS